MLESKKYIKPIHDCRVDGCENKTQPGRTLCQMHRARLYKGIDMELKKHEPRFKKPVLCSVDWCEKKAVCKGYCHMHYYRSSRGLDMDQPPYTERKKHITSGGYVDVKVRGKWMKEHRHIMEKHIGRKLKKQETVHHRNGVRSDNRIENLELWECSHPHGQRAKDKLEWAWKIIERYEPIKHKI